MITITIGSNSYNLCAMPSTPGPAEIELGMSDSVAVVESPFTKVQQVQPWPGADFWDATITLPPLRAAQAWAWEGFLAELRGKANVFQLGDPRAANGPQGSAAGTPVVATSGSANLPSTTSLVTRGWAASAFRLLLPGDQFQIGYRLHRVCEIVNSDSGGNATLTVWPSLRETPADGTEVVLAAPQGLFRLASNRRPIHASPQRLTTISFQCIEVR
jgi:hypothetical protein